MHFKKIFVLIVLSMVIVFVGCAKKDVEAPKQERITKKLIPPKAEVNGTNFFIELRDLEVITVEDIASKEIVDTPHLRGRIKITNKSNDNLDIQALALEYLDVAGKPIDFQSEENIKKASLFFRVLKPKEIFDGQLDVTIPKKAIKEKTLGKIEVNLVYVSSPLSRETATFPEKIE
ncbi:hypothetical protein ACFL0H_15005 [Thermodesulfobacteriota bacterium]